MNFFRTTPGIILTLIVVVVAAYLIGTSQWFAKLFVPKAPAEGSGCVDINGNSGTIQSGVCVAQNLGGGPAEPPVNISLRVATAPDIITFRKTGNSFPAFIPYMGHNYRFSYAFGRMGYYKRIYADRITCTDSTQCPESAGCFGGECLPTGLPGL